MRGTVQLRRGRWVVDPAANIGTLTSQQIILDELQDFLAEHYGADRAASAGTVLDLGAGAKPYAPVYDAYFGSSTAVDVPHSPHDTGGVDVLASADSLPFGDGSFDCVICTEVLEHCRDPRAVMAEIARVLKDGGRAFVTTPFFVPLHEMPHDYYRFTPSALEDLAAGAALEVRSIHARGGYLAVALRVLQMPLTKIFQRLSRVTRLPLYSRFNPLVYVTVVLPEQLCLSAWRRGRRRSAGRLARLQERSSYYTLGYMTQLEKVRPTTRRG